MPATMASETNAAPKRGEAERAPEAVVGATGYIGRHLIRRLAREGRPVRALARDPSRVEALPGVEAAKGDLLGRARLDRALEGCRVAYYLVHSMEAADDADFAARDRRAVTRFVRAAERAGVERAVYLGGPVPPDTPPSPHLASRLEVEQTILEALPRSTALRASIVVGAESAPFRVLVRLVERLRVLPFPGWWRNRTRPLDERDAMEYLARTPSTRQAEGRSLDIAGPDVLSYGEMLERIAEVMGVGRVQVAFGASLTPAASAVVSAVTDQPLELVRPLMFSLEHDLLPRNDDARRIYGLKPRPFERSVEHALREWESSEVLGAR
jgi:uncharacterized protein YbjT (DUF2867 family)